MKLKKFIELLKEYPMDSEVWIGDQGIDDLNNIFKISQLKDDDAVVISTPPFSVDHMDWDDEYTKKVSYNKEDTFTLEDYSHNEIITGKYDDFKPLCQVKPEEYYHNREARYENTDGNLSYVGGLKKFLQVFPDETPINMKCGDGRTGVIHEIEKRIITYFTGVDTTTGDVYEDSCEELFFIYGVPVSGYCGGGSIPLIDDTPEFWTDEIPTVIAEPIKKYFQKENIELSDEEDKKWSQLVLDIKQNLIKYYRLSYRLNGSWDSNGYFHPEKDNGELYFKPKIKESVDGKVH